MEKTVAIVAGGQLVESFIPHIRDCSVIIGVDYGAYWLLSHKIVPQVAIGDFDSVSKQEFSEITKHILYVKKHPTTKNETDMELALMYAQSLSPRSISLYGGIGTRLDHSLGNIFLLEKTWTKKYQVMLYTPTSEVSFIVDFCTVEKSRYQYVSILSISASSLVSLSGFLYPLHRTRIYRRQTIGISNELIKQQGKIVVHAGKILVIQSNDKPEK